MKRPNNKTNGVLPATAIACQAWGQNAGCLRRVLDAVAAVLVTDAQGRIRETSPRFCDLSGFSGEELLGNNFPNLSTARFPLDFNELWSQVSLGDIWEGEVVLQKKNGMPYWLRLVITPVLLNEERLMIWAGQDITEFKQEREDTAMWLRSNLWLERVKQEYLTRRKETSLSHRPLSIREEQVLRFVAAGLANKNIAVQLNISVRTVEIHRAHLMKKLGIRTTAALVKYAIENGYTT